MQICISDGAVGDGQSLLTERTAQQLLGVRLRSLAADFSLLILTWFLSVCLVSLFVCLFVWFVEFSTPLYDVEFRTGCFGTLRVVRPPPSLPPPPGKCPFIATVRSDFYAISPKDKCGLHPHSAESILQ